MSIHYGCIAVSVAFAIAIVRVAGWESGSRLPPVVAGEVVALAALALSYLGQWAWAIRLAALGALAVDAIMAAEAQDGFRSIALLGFPGLLVVAVLVMRAADYLVLAGATLLTVTVLGVAEINGLIPWVPIARSPTTYATILMVDLVLVMTAFLGGLLARDARLNLASVRATVDRLATTNLELARSEAKYRSFVELAADAIFVTTPGGTILEVSRQAERLTGVDRERLLGTPMTSLLLPRLAEEDPFPLDLLARGVPVMRPCRIGRHDGRVVEAEMHSAMLPEGPILCFCRDITERRQAEAERKILQDQLIQAQKLESIGRLAGGIAHDFNNLLTVINGYSQLLLETLPQSDPSRESLEEINKAGDRAANLTQQLLAFSRKQMLQFQVFDLNRVVWEMHTLLARTVGENLELKLDLCQEAATIRADPRRLEQVIMNLAVNARDAMAGGGTLRIGTACEELSQNATRLHPGARPGRYAVLTVSDTGTGMDQDTRHHLFEPFFTTKEIGKGTGLGLAMVLGVVEQSGGFIEVDSELGRGTVFRIHLPMADDAARPVKQPAAVPAAALRGNETVLVVEGHAEVRKFAADALSPHGYRVIQAENALEAENLCGSEAEPIDLVLTDLVMPGVSGGELAQWLATHRPGIKVLFISGYADDELIRQESLRQDAEFIRKPFSPSQLALKVREMLGPPEKQAVS